MSENPTGPPDPAELGRLLEVAIQHADEAFVITDAQLDPPGPRILYVNAGFERMTGYRRGEVLGKTPRILQGPRTDRTVLDRLRERLSAGEAFVGEAINYRKDRSEFWLEWYVSPVRDERGRVTHFVSLQRDVTARKRAEAAAREGERTAADERVAFQEKRLQAQRLESLGAFASGIAHDFNNILTAILGNASLWRSQLSPESEEAAIFEEIETAAERGSELVRSMLDYAGRSATFVEPTDLVALVRDLSKLVEACCAKRTTLEYRFEEGVPQVRADPTQLRQVLLNLATNASEALGGSGGTVCIRVGSVELDRRALDALVLGEGLATGTYSFLEVSDDGCGLSEESRHRIFDPYFSTKRPGRGLGLATVLGVVRSHEGAIELESRAGVGTRFRILLPASSPAALASPEAARTDTDPSASVPPGAVLFIDDEAGICRFARRALEPLGIDVLTAADAEAGLALLRSDPRVSAIFLDLVMPGMTADEAMAEFERLRPGIPVVLMSGYVAPGATTTGEGRAVGLLQKPFSADDLEAWLREAWWVSQA